MKIGETGLDVEEQADRDQKPKPGKRWMKIVGWSLMVISTITWTGGLFVVPFLPLETKTKLAWGGALFGIGEITFYGAIPFLGKELVFIIRRYFNPFAWFRKKEEKTNESEPDISQS